MIELQATLQGAEDMARRIESARQRAVKAKQTAIKVEAFRLLKKLRAEVRQGTPGGKPYDNPKLSAIASYTKSGRLKKNTTPLARLAKLLRYKVSGDNLQNFAVEFGFTDTARSRLSRSYKQILIANQQGAEVLYSGSRTELGARLARIGGKLKKKGNADARLFFLRKSGRNTMKLPSRDIINTHWQANQQEAVRNIQKNFQAKMRGERI
jgi:hypothetical protein